MTKLKKLISISLMAAMVLAPIFSFATTAGGASSDPTASLSQSAAESALKLQNLGLYAGTSTASYAPDLGSTISREAGITMLIRILGLESEASSMSEASVSSTLSGYTDADTISSWAKKYVACAVQHGMVSGTSATTLSPSSAFSGRAYATIMLKQLGYSDFTYATAPTVFSQTAGLSGYSDGILSSGTLTRGTLVGLACSTLTVQNSSGQTVIGNLISSGVVSAPLASNVLGIPTTQLVAGAAAPTTAISTSVNNSTGHHNSGSDSTITISGLADTTVAMGASPQAIHFTVSAADAVVSVSGVSGSALNAIASDYSVTGSGVSYTLNFTPNVEVTGTAILMVSAAKSGYTTAVQQISITVLPKLDMSHWTDDWGYYQSANYWDCTLGTIAPTGITFTTEFTNSALLTSAIITEGTTQPFITPCKLTVTPTSPTVTGSAIVTITARKDGYITGTHTVIVSISL